MKPIELPELLIKYGKELDGMGRPSSRWYLANGLCWYYAYVFKHILGGEIYSYQNKKGWGHCFIKYNGLFYDAESLSGKKSWKELQRYLNKVSDKNLVKHRSLSGFVNHWKISCYQEDFNKSVFNIQEYRRLTR